MNRDRLRSLMRRHNAQLLQNRVTFLVLVGGVWANGRLTGAETLRYEVIASDLGTVERTRRADSTRPEESTRCYIPIPTNGLPFEPSVGQQVEASGVIWHVGVVRKHTVDGVAVGYWVQLTAGRPA